MLAHFCFFVFRVFWKVTIGNGFLKSLCDHSSFFCFQILKLFFNCWRPSSVKRTVSSVTAWDFATFPEVGEDIKRRKKNYRMLSPEDAIFAFWLCFAPQENRKESRIFSLVDDLWVFFFFLKHFCFNLTNTLSVTPNSRPTSSTYDQFHHAKPKTHFNNLRFPRSKILENFLDILLENLPACRFCWRDGFVILNKVSQFTVFFCTNRSFEWKNILGYFFNVTNLLDFHIHFSRKFLYSWFTSNSLCETTLRVRQLVDGLHHVHGNTNRSCFLISNSTRNCLSIHQVA